MTPHERAIVDRIAARMGCIYVPKEIDRLIHDSMDKDFRRIDVVEPNISQAARDAAQALCASGWTHAIEAFARFEAMTHEAATEAAISEMETRFWSIVDPNSVPSDMWQALNQMAAAYRQAKERDATIRQLGENAAKAAGEYAEEVARLRDALAWYAKDYDYERGCSQWDGGTKARAALTEPTDG